MRDGREGAGRRLGKDGGQGRRREGGRSAGNALPALEADANDPAGRGGSVRRGGSGRVGRGIATLGSDRIASREARERCIPRGRDARRAGRRPACDGRIAAPDRPAQRLRLSRDAQQHPSGHGRQGGERRDQDDRRDPEPSGPCHGPRNPVPGPRFPDRGPSVSRPCGSEIVEECSQVVDFEAFAGIFAPADRNRRGVKRLRQAIHNLRATVDDLTGWP